MNNLRPYLGAVFFVLAWILPLFGILVAKLNLSLAAKAVIISLLTVGGPELLGLLAVLCLGKKNLIHLKNKILAWLNRLKPAAPVSRIRYRVGLVMFLVPLVSDLHYGLCAAVAPGLFPSASLRQSDRGLFLSIQPLVPGGDFWNKLLALFVYDSRVEFGP